MAYYGNMLVDPRTNARYVEVLQTGSTPQLRAGHRYGRVRDDDSDNSHRKLPIAITADRFYSMVKYAGVATTVALLTIVIIGSSMVFNNNYTNTLFFVNTFLTQYDNANSLTWPVLTNNTWSALTRSTSPYTDVKFEQKYECFYQAGIAGPNGPVNSVMCSTFTNAADWTNCLKLNYNALLSICATTNYYNYKTLWPTSAQYQTCIANNFNITRQQYNAFDQCLKTDLWPLFDIAQDIDSPYLLGSFNWMLLLSTGLFIYTMFALWTCSPFDGAEEAAVIQYGKPTGRWARMSMTWSGIAAVGILIWTIITLCLVYRASTFAYNTGTNAAMNNVGAGLLIFFVSFLALIYFALELLEFYDGYDRDGLKRAHITESRLNEYTPNPSKAFDVYVKDPSKVADRYTPILMVAWADAYMCDALIYTGLIGATAHVSTADVYSVFGWILLYRLIQSGAVRLFYEAYIHNEGENAIVNDSKMNGLRNTNSDSFPTKIAALAYHLAATFCLIEVCFIIFNPNKASVDYSLLIYMVIFGLLIPEVLRTIGHLCVAFMNGRDHSIPILLFTQFIWWWDVAVRLVLFCFVLWGPTGTGGTYPFLSDQYTSMTTTLAFAGTNN